MAMKIILVLLLITSIFIEARPLEDVNEETSELNLKSLKNPNWINYLTTMDVVENPEPMCDDCEIDYDIEEKERNDFNKVIDELEGEHDGFPINAVGYLILVSGFALALI
jgi:hypothetical protein